MDADATPEAPEAPELEQLRSAAAELEQRIATADAELLAARERDSSSTAAIVEHERRCAELTAERDGLRSTLEAERRADVLRRIGASNTNAAKLLLDAAIVTQQIDLATADALQIAALVGHVQAGLTVVGTSPRVQPGQPHAQRPGVPRGAALAP